jgi:adenylate cyclase
MGLEIEKKFLLRDDSWKQSAVGTHYVQGYLMNDRGITVRARIAGDTGYLTVKGPSQGAGRQEYEYEIPVADAEPLLRTLCKKPLIEKTRYKIDHAGFTWEIDVFHGENKGLVVAEIELDSEDQHFELPPWAGEEVTGERRYYNAQLVLKPYSTW